MNAIREKIIRFSTDWRILVVTGIPLFFIILFVVSSKDKIKERIDIEKTTITSLADKSSTAENSGLFLGEDVDRKAFVGRLEEQYHSTQDKNRQIETKIDALEKTIADMARNQSVIHETMMDMQKKLADSTMKFEMGLSTDSAMQDSGQSNYRLDVITVNPVSERESEGVFLPAGSFVRGTLLTGVYAPSDQNNPLPVLIRLNEAFFGPNEARIPLEGAFVIGKASGELNSERALVQAVTLSVVLPDGKEFQHHGNIGYVTDINGELGIKGVVVRNTGNQMAASFMSGFLGGASQAVADGETTITTSPTGRVSRNVTGNITKQAAFQGFSQSASQLSKYYSDQLNAIVPAIRVESGVDVYLIILEGVKINGLEINKPGGIDYLD